MSNLIGFWNSKSAEADSRYGGQLTKPLRRERVERRQYEAIATTEEGDNDNAAGHISKPPSPSNPSSTGCPRNPTGRDQKADDRPKPTSPFTKFRQLESMQGSNSKGLLPRPSPMTILSRNSSLPPSPRPTITHAQMVSQGTGTNRTGSSAKDIILGWVQHTIQDYPIRMSNFSSCWADGLAFCALIHSFYPHSFAWSSLRAEDREHNFTLAFSLAEQLASISPLLEVEDMVRYRNPDWKCVFTYVQSFYRRFRNCEKPGTTPVPTQEPVVTAIPTTITSSSLSPSTACTTPVTSKSCRSISLSSGPAPAIVDKASTGRKHSFTSTSILTGAVLGTRQ